MPNAEELLLIIKDDQRYKKALSRLFPLLAPPEQGLVRWTEIVSFCFMENIYLRAEGEDYLDLPGNTQVQILWLNRAGLAISIPTTGPEGPGFQKQIYAFYA